MDPIAGGGGMRSRKEPIKGTLAKKTTEGLGSLLLARQVSAREIGHPLFVGGY